jgi:internalin A
MNLDGLAEAKVRIAKCVQSRDRSLDLSRLGLRQLPEEVRSLTWLTRLLAVHNHISEVPEFIGELKELETLRFTFNPIKKLPESLPKLTRLTYLSIAGGEKSAASPAIGELRNLRLLFMSGLKLDQFPNWIPNLKNLETLVLTRNSFKELPKSLLGLTKLRTLALDDVFGIPREICQDDNAREILNYYFRIKGPASQSQPLNEFKLILVGRGGVGKTTLVHRVTTDKYKEFKRTPGINITKWPVEIDDDQVQAHIWDFGGQEIMHGTHRFFMTERALYLILISGREGTEDRDAEYWLSLVRSFAGNVPIIVLLNKCDDYSFELNRQLLKEKYGGNLVFIETDSRSGTGMPQLRERICQLAKKLPGLKAAWPSEWRQILCSKRDRTTKRSGSTR